MTNRLQKLRQEQERIKRALANDSRWVELVGSLRTNGNGSRLSGLDPKTVGMLAKHELFTAYVAVTRAIEELQAPASTASSDPAATETVKPAKPFRTRVTIKPSSNENRPGGDEGRVDDLTAIRGIDRKLAVALNELGVRSYQTIAEWDRYEVRRVRDELQLGKRIWRENWIEQAALLRLHQLDQPTPMPVAPVSEAEPTPAGERAYAEEAPVESTTEVTPVKALAAGVAMPVAAAVAAAAATSFGEFVEDGDASEPASDDAEPTLAGPAADDAETISPEPSASPDLTDTTSEILPEPRASERAAPDSEGAETKMVKVGRRPQRLPAPAARRFVYLSGVSEEMAEALRSVGVKSIADIAAWTRADVRWFQAILGDKARISHDQWIEQATLLSKGVWTAYALRVVRGETRALVRAPDPISVGTPALRIDRLHSAGAGEPVVGADVATAGAAATAIIESDVKIVVAEEDHAPEPPRDDAQASSEEAVPTEADDAALAARAPDPAIESDTADAAGVEISQQQFEAIDTDNQEPLAPHESVDPPQAEFTSLTMRAKLPPTARFDPMRGLTTAIALGKLKRPPPDLGASKPRKLPVPTREPTPAPTPTPEPSAEPVSEAASVIPPVRLEPPSAVFDDAVEAPPSDVDDWEDAEALVIKRVPAANPVPSERSLPVASAEVPAIDDSAPLAHDDDDWQDAATPWRDEADVVIVSKPRSDAGVPTATPRPRPESATERARRQLGLTSAPKTDTGREAVVLPDDEPDVAYGSYSDTTEEAMVTIIRAEASEEDASTIMPNNIANDVSGPDQRGSQSDQPAKRDVRAIGSRFLKALTGD